MPVSVLTARVIDGTGQVRAVRMAPFLVLAPGESAEEGVQDLERVIGELQVLAEELENARTDPSHPHHHWWRP